VEQEATIDAIQKLPTTGVRGVITMLAALGNYDMKNSKTRKIRQIMD
jgi:hypothetical protein